MYPLSRASTSCRILIVNPEMGFRERPGRRSQECELLIGSGTRMALEDAITLSRAFAMTGDVRAAFQTFEDLRRPSMERLLDIARQSAT